MFALLKGMCIQTLVLTFLIWPKKSVFNKICHKRIKLSAVKKLSPQGDCVHNLCENKEQLTKPDTLWHWPLCSDDQSFVCIFCSQVLSLLGFCDTIKYVWHIQHPTPLFSLLDTGLKSGFRLHCTWDERNTKKLITVKSIT